MSIRERVEGSMMLVECERNSWINCCDLDWLGLQLQMIGVQVTAGVPGCITVPTDQEISV